MTPILPSKFPVAAQWWYYQLKGLLLLPPAPINRIPGHLMRAEGLLLQDLVRSLKEPATIIVEIGSYLGRSTAYLAQVLPSPHIQLHCIDTWHSDGMTEEKHDTFATFMKNIEPWHQQITVHRGFAHDIAGTWQQSIDLLWIDGDHTYEQVRQDIIDWVKWVKPGSYIAFHDYGNPCGVAQAVTEQNDLFSWGGQVAGSIYVAIKK